MPPDLNAAWLATDPVAVGLVGAAAAVFVLAILTPAIVLGLLLVVLVLQPAAVGAGVAGARYADEVLLVTVAAALLVRWWLSGLPVPRRTPITLPLGSFILVAIVSAAANGVPVLIAILGTFAVLKGLLAAELFARVHWSARARSWLAVALAVFMVVLVAVGIAQRLGGAVAFDFTGQTDAFNEWQGAKVPSLLTNHNAFGQTMALFVAVALGQAWAVGSKGTGRQRIARELPDIRREGWLALASAAMVGLVLSASREAWLATVAALIAGAWVLRSGRAMRFAVTAGVALLLAGSVVYAGSANLRAEWSRRTAGVASGWHDYDLGFDGRTFRGEYRVYVLRKSWDIWRHYPVLGTGPGRFGGHVATLFPSPVYDEFAFLAQGEGGKPEPLDVFWSRLLTEWGVIGTAVYLWALFAAWRVFRQARLAGAASWRRGLGLAGAMLVVAVAVLGWFAPVLEEPLVAVPFWAVAGLAWGGGGQRAAEAATSSAARTARI